MPPFADTLSALGILLVGWKVSTKWVIWFAPTLRCRATFLGLIVGTFVAFQTVLGITLARASWWSPTALLVAWFVLAATLFPFSGQSRNVLMRRNRVPMLLGAVALAYALLWMSFPHRDLMGERDGGVYMATAAELARTGDFGWTDFLSTTYGLQRTYTNFEYLGMVYQHYPRFLLFPGFYLDEPELQVTPQFLGGYEPWLALALRSFGEPGLFRTNPALMAVGLFVFGCAVTRFVGSRAGVGAMVLCGGILAVQWHARSAGNESLTFLLTWTCILAYRQVLASPAHGFSGWLLFLPALALGQLKLAGWLLFPILAIDAGFRWGIHPQFRPNLFRAILALFLAGALASAQGAVFCSKYLFGSYIHMLASRGVPYEAMLVGLPALVLGAALGGGWLGAWLVHRGHLTVPVRLNRLWMWVGCLIFVGLGRFALSIQREHLEDIDNIWSNAANLAELANYLPTGHSLMGLAGLLWLCVSIQGRSRTIILGLLAMAGFMILNRNIDSLHPWASRRWVPVVFPACCLGISYLLVQGVRDLGRLPIPIARRFWQPLLLPAAFLSSAFLIQRPGLPLIVSQPGRELDQSHQRLQQLLGKESVVFALPSANVRRWLPWQLGRYGTISYALHGDSIAWSAMIPVFQDLQRRGHRVLYLTDFPPQPWTIDQGLLRLVGSEELSWYAQREEVRSLPVWPATRYITRLFAYEVTTTGSQTTGWFPESPAPPVPRARPQGPLPWSLPLSGSLAVASDGWKQPQEGQTTGPLPAGSAWATMRSRVSLGEILDLPRDFQTSSSSLVGWNIDVKMRSGRDSRDQVPIHIVRQRSSDLEPEILASMSVGPNWTTVTVGWGVQRLSGESTLEIRSQRPPLGSILPEGHVGVLVAPLFVQPVFATPESREVLLTTPSAVLESKP